MVDGALDRYTAERPPDVLARPGVSRAAWWDVVRRDGRGLPRVLPEFPHVAVYEVESGFLAPDPIPAVLTGAHHFVRTPRPGQGTLSGRPTIGLSLVLI